MKRFLFMSIIFAGLCSFSVKPGKLHPEQKITIKMQGNDLPEEGDDAFNWMSNPNSRQADPVTERTEEENKYIADMSQNGRWCIFIYDKDKETLCKRYLVVYDCNTGIIISVSQYP